MNVFSRSLPVAVVTAAGFVAVAGGVISAIGQITVDDKAKKELENQYKTRDGD